MRSGAYLLIEQELAWGASGRWFRSSRPDHIGPRPPNGKPDSGGGFLLERTTARRKRRRPIVTLAVTEAGCLGVALLACAARTGAKPRDLVGTWVKTTSVVDPDPRRAKLYEERFGRYRELYPMIREWMCDNDECQRTNVKGRSKHEGQRD